MYLIVFSDLSPVKSICSSHVEMGQQYSEKRRGGISNSCCMKSKWTSFINGLTCSFSEGKLLSALRVSVLLWAVRSSWWCMWSPVNLLCAQSSSTHQSGRSRTRALHCLSPLVFCFMAQMDVLLVRVVWHMAERRTKRWITQWWELAAGRSYRRTEL